MIMKKNVVIFITIALVVGFIWAYNSVPWEVPENLYDSEEDIDQEKIIDESLLVECEKDSDCIVVDYSDCCGSTKRAINKLYLDEYNANQDWQKFDDPDTCALIGQCLDDSHVTSALCRNNICWLDY